MIKEKFYRNCPTCSKEIEHTNKSNCLAAIRLQSNCRSCQAKKKIGNKNPFFGKHHNEESRKKISRFNLEDRIWTEDFKNTARCNLSKITNNKSLHSIWVEKFGKDIADQKLIDLKKKHSNNNSGKNNPMFGKPSPQGSGNGWSGWYNEWYFRSIRELSFMINFIEKNNLLWKTPDKEFKIPYTDYNGKDRFYFPDFIIGNKVIEIKPLKLQNSPQVLAKKNAAELFCKSLNMLYEIIDPELLSDHEIGELYFSKKIKFLPKYDEKFKERYLQCQK